MTIEPFGRCDEGEVRRVTISGGGLTATIMEWGAVLQNLRLDGHAAPLVLGFERFDDYPAHSPHFGAAPGRYANRIAGGRFVIDGQQYQADLNQAGKHMLHGGSKGYSKRLWRIADHGADFVTLTLHSPDGDMGFPGNLDASCTYRTSAKGTLAIELTATTDKPTLCNLTNHSYFNLDDGGAGEILDHRLTIAAGAYLPNDPDAVPTGVVQPVDGTDFDFRAARTIRSVEPQTEYDNNFCLSAAKEPLRQVSLAKGGRSGVAMETWTTEPGIQFYMGHKIKSDMPAGLDGIKYGPSSGFCLEAQVWPDSPNRPYFPQAILRPGETYRHVTEYRFGLP